MSGEAPPQLRRNSEFYLDWITFQVEDELFKIPIRCVTFDTEPFKTLSSRSLPSGDGPVEGMSDEFPIALSDTSKYSSDGTILVHYRFTDVLAFSNFRSKPITSVRFGTRAEAIDKVETLGCPKLRHRDDGPTKPFPSEMLRYGRDYKLVNTAKCGAITVLAILQKLPVKTVVDEGTVRTNFNVEVAEIVADEKCFDPGGVYIRSSVCRLVRGIHDVLELFNSRAYTGWLFYLFRQGSELRCCKHAFSPRWNLAQATPPDHFFNHSWQAEKPLSTANR
ncbi:hypothetical protein IMY05_C4767000200 [Salix suchowensis]|nr:hypothetical protein IMY05_C4767000200 [Salix suchowensis]